MTVGPEDGNQIYNRIVRRLTDVNQFPSTTIKRLTNFLDGSFNQVWIETFSTELRRAQIRATAAQLSGWIDYAGGDVDEDDLRELGINDDVTPSQLNQFMEDDDLENLLEILSVERNTGEQSTVTLKIFTNESREITVPEGTAFGTQPENDGSFREYQTLEETTIPQDPTSSDRDNVGEDNRGKWVEVGAEAEEVGAEYDVPAGTITYLVDPPTGIDGVINESASNGGTDAETNDEFRERAKEKLRQSSQGGTTDGIEGFIIENTAADDVIFDEFYNGNNPERPLVSWPHVEVVVDGGDEQTVLDAIRESQPTGVEHFLVRPTLFTIAIETQIEGTDISTDIITEDLEQLYDELAIGESVYRDKTIQAILNADENVVNIETLDILIENESFDLTTSTDSFTYDSTQTTYSLTENIGTVVQVIDTNDAVYNVDDDYTVDTTNDEINWLDTPSSEPADGTSFTVRYIAHPTETISRIYDPDKSFYEIEPFDAVNSVSDDSQTYTEGTDYDVLTTGIEWIDSGDSPPENAEFDIEYVDADTKYRVEKFNDIDTVDSVEIVNPNEGEPNTELVENTDWVQYANGIEFVTDSNITQDEQLLVVTYSVENDIAIDDREKASSGTINITVV